MSEKPLSAKTRIAIGSQNPVKLSAALKGFQATFPKLEISAQGFEVRSGVSDQPMSSEETRRGATNRAAKLKQRQPDFDYWIGIEGGIETIGQDWFASAWIVVLSEDGTIGEAKSALFPLPPRVKLLVESGLELGHANDQVFSEQNSKHAGGAVGSLTDGLITRQSLYQHAMTLALIPFLKPALFSTL